ncbi:hypothetical protein LTR28_002536 [Elasticomyces elasticus]|nr:hypothetical protein LTR28_002536 [Elasticomyces elasticus]
MSNLDPQGPSQPTLSQAYTTPGNPATSTPSEKSSASATSSANAHSSTTEQRVPSQQTTSQSEATPTSVARGIRAPDAREVDTDGGNKGGDDGVGGRSGELDGEQMAAPGEGRVADVVQEKPGASGAQEGLESDLDRKKAEQAPAREAIKAQRAKDVDVAGVLGQRGGPATPVDKGNYPNSSS